MRNYQSATLRAMPKYGGVSYRTQMFAKKITHALKNLRTEKANIGNGKSRTILF